MNLAFGGNADLAAARRRASEIVKQAMVNGLTTFYVAKDEPLKEINKEQRKTMQQKNSMLSVERQEQRQVMIINEIHDKVQEEVAEARGEALVICA